MNECQFVYIIEKKDSTSTSFSQNILQKSWGLQIETLDLRLTSLNSHHILNTMLHLIH